MGTELALSLSTCPEASGGFSFFGVLTSVVVWFFGGFDGVVLVPPPLPLGEGSVVAAGAGSFRIRAWSARWMSSFALE